MVRALLLVLIVVFIGFPCTGNAAGYAIERVAPGVYAAIADPTGKLASNAFIVVTDNDVVLAGAHFTADGVKELTGQIAKLTNLPLKFIVLTHHHGGTNYLDFDFPPGVEVITSWQSWKTLSGEFREFRNPVAFIERSISLRRGKQVIVITNIDQGQSDGDIIIYLPGERVLFTSDLVYHKAVGSMANGYMRQWIHALEQLEELEPRKVVPGLGPVGDDEVIISFKLFLKDFLSQVLHHVEKGAGLAEVKKSFVLPQYEQVPGYRTYLEGNLERAYQQLKQLEK